MKFYLSIIGETQIDEKFNIKFLIIVDEPVELSNLFDRASKVNIPELKLEPPEIRGGTNSSGFFSITTGIPGFRFQKIINGYDLFISNVIYGEKKRGGFRVEIPNNDNLITSRITYEKLHELVVNPVTPMYTPMKLALISLLMV